MTATPAWNEAMAAMVAIESRARLSHERPREARSSWARTLARLRAAAVSRDGATPASADADALPFVEVWAGLARALADELRAPGLDTDELRAARRGLARWAERELASLGLHVLLRAFTRHRNAGAPSSSQDAGPRAAYDAFVRGLARGGLDELLVAHPIWARMVGSALAHAKLATERALADWRSDRAELERRFPGLLAAPLRGVDVGLSEPHAGGRTVLRLRFAEAGALYYKPRPLTGEAAIAGLLADLGAGPRSRGAELRVLARADHGWVAAIEHRPADSRASWLAYHRRAGALAFALFALGGTDAHADNVIAHGRDPVLIDAECVLHPTLIHASERDEVGRTGLLPRWRRDRDGRWSSQAGLSDPRPFEPRRPRWQLLDCNTDAMRLARGLGRGNAGTNAPWPAPTGPPGSHERERADAVAAGFAEAYRIFVARPELRAAALARAELHRARVVVRPTAHYLGLADRLAHPSACASAAAAEAALVPALRGCFAALAPERRASVDALVRAEASQLLARDVPLFHCAADGTALAPAPAGAPIPGLVERSPIAAMRARLDRLGPDDLAAQLACIRAAFERPAQPRREAATSSIDERSERLEARS